MGVFSPGTRSSASKQLAFRHTRLPSIEPRDVLSFLFFSFFLFHFVMFLTLSLLFFYFTLAEKIRQEYLLPRCTQLSPNSMLVLWHLSSGLLQILFLSLVTFVPVCVYIFIFLNVYVFAYFSPMILLK